MRIDWREIRLIPNLLTLIRLVLLPLPIMFIAQGRDAATLALLGFAIVTDILDGVLARKLNQVSELGKLLDPLADKLGMAALVITLALYRDFPWWAAAIIIARDLLLLIGGLSLLGKTDVIPTSNLFGKFTALTWLLLVISYLTPYLQAQRVLLVLAVAMVPISLALYLRKRV
jgi:cardiolipin synthase (CMP-forming)